MNSGSSLQRLLFNMGVKCTNNRLKSKPLILKIITFFAALWDSHRAVGTPIAHTLEIISRSMPCFEMRKRIKTYVDD